MRLGLWSSPEDAFLEFVYASEEEGLLQLIIRSKHQSCCCPDCGKASFRPHSHYTRIIQDLPIGEKAVSLLLISRKWFCDNPVCDRKIFTERYDWIVENGRRTMRAEGVLREIAFSSSCLNGEKLARTVHLPVSHDTLLSIIKKTEINPVVSPFRRYVGLRNDADQKCVRSLQTKNEALTILILFGGLPPLFCGGRFFICWKIGP